MAKHALHIVLMVAADLHVLSASSIRSGIALSIYRTILDIMVRLPSSSFKPKYASDNEFIIGR